MGYEQAKHAGRKRSGRPYCCLLRAMRTTQERRLWDAEYGRDRRAPHRLPNAWWDYLRSDWRHRTWKRHRRSQWKSKPPRGNGDGLFQEAYPASV